MADAQTGSDRLPNGLTPAQDAAFDALARALAEHCGGDHA